MKFLKSIILLMFCIGWVKAVQYNIDNEFNKIFYKIRESMDNAWKWMQVQTSRSMARLNEIFAVRRPTEQSRHKYQDVAPSDDPTIKSEAKLTQTENASPPIPSDNIVIQSNTESTQTENSPLPETTTTKDNETPSDTTFTAPKIEPSTTPEELHTTVDLPDSTTLQQTTPNQTDTTEEVQQETEKPDPECEDTATEETTTLQNSLVPETQPQAEIPLPDEYVVSKLESPAVQEIEKIDLQLGEGKNDEPDVGTKSTAESSIEKEKVSSASTFDPVEHFENDRYMKMLKDIYEKQTSISITIFFLSLACTCYFISRYLEFCEYETGSGRTTVIVAHSRIDPENLGRAKIVDMKRAGDHIIKEVKVK